MGKEVLNLKEIKTLKKICKLYTSSNQQTVNVKALIRSKIAFTERELLIIRLTCQEHKAEEIASKLALTERTVEKVKTEIFRKTGMRNSLGLLKYSITHGLYTIKA